MTSLSRDADVETTPALHLVDNPEDTAHLVCCRDPDWSTTWCGLPAEEINLTAGTVCTLCVAMINEQAPGALTHVPPLCPVDHRPCPDEHEIDLRILRETSR